MASPRGLSRPLMTTATSGCAATLDRLIAQATPNSSTDLPNRRLMDFLPGCSRRDRTIDARERPSLVEAASGCRTCTLTQQLLPADDDANLTRQSGGCATEEVDAGAVR